MNRPATGPRPIARADGTTTHTTGTLHTAWIRLTDAARPRTISPRKDAMTKRDRTEADRKFFELRESGYTGPINQDGEKATPANTDPRLLDTLKAVHDLPAWSSYEK